MPGLLLLLPLPGGGRQLFFLCGFLYVKSVEGFLLRRRGWWWRGLPSLLTGLFLFFRDALLLVSRLLRRPCPEGSNM